MAIALVTSFSNQNKTSGTNITPIGVAGYLAAGNETIFIFVAYDNLTATTPTVSSILRASGTDLVLSWSQVSSFNSPQAAAAGGVRGELWRADVPAPGTVSATVTLSAAVTAKAVLAVVFTGVGAIVGTASTNNTGASLSKTMTTGELFLCMNGTENSSVAALSGFTSTVNLGSTGGSGVTNVWANISYRISVAGGSESTSSTLTDGGLIVARFGVEQPPTLTQTAYRFYADGTESGSTALAAQDTALTVDTSGGDVPLQLRVRVQETGTGRVTGDTDFQVQFEKNASGSWANALPLNVSTDIQTVGSGQTSDSTHSVVGQSFMGDGRPLVQAKFMLSKNLSPAGNVQAQLRAHDGGTFGGTGKPGAVLATSTTAIAASTLAGAPNNWYTFDFDGTYTMAAGTAYFITVVTATGAGGAVIVYQEDGNTAPGAAVRLTDPSTWTVTTASDILHEVVSVLSGAVAPYVSASLDNTAPTTNRLTGGSGSFVPGDITEDGVANDFGWSQSNYTEFLYSLTLRASELAPSDTVRFRVVRNGTALNTYSQVPTINIASTGPQTFQVSGTVPVVTTAVGDATRVPLQFQAAGSVVVSTAASGDATVFVPPVVHQVSGTVAVSTAASGAVSLRQPVSGTVPVVVGASGAVTANLRVAGTIPVVVGVTGDATRVPIQFQVSGTVPVTTVATGTVSSTQSAAGVVPVVTTAVGDATIVAGAVQHQVSGSVAVTVAASGTVSARLAASGTVPVVVGTAGTVSAILSTAGIAPVTVAAIGTVTARLAVAGIVPVLTTAVGDATRVPLQFQASGTVPVVTTAVGNVTAQSGAQQYQVAGTVPVVTTATGDATRVPITFQVSGTAAVVTAASGAISLRQPVSGTVPVVTTVSGAAVTSPKPVSGTVAVVTTVNGAVSAQLPVSGTAPIVTTAAGSVSQSLVVSGTAAVVTSASGAVSKQQQVSGTVAVNTTASGTVSARLQAAGTAPVTVNAVGAVTSKQMVSGTVPVITNASGSALPAGFSSGTVVVTVGVTGSVTSKQGVSGTPAAVTTGVSGTVTSRQQVAGTAAVTVGVTGAVQINPRGRVDVVTGVSGTVSQVHKVSGTVAVATSVSGAVAGGSPTSGTAAVSTTVSGNVTVNRAVSGTVAVVTTVSGAANIEVKQYQVSGRVDVTTTSIGTFRAIYSVLGTVVVLTEVSGVVTGRELPPFPCGDLLLVPSGPLLSLSGSGVNLVLRGELDPLPLAGTSEGYSLSKTAERLTLEGVC